MSFEYDATPNIMYVAENIFTYFYLILFCLFSFLSQNAQYKEILQYVEFFMANCYLEVQNAPLKLASPIS